MHVKVQFWGPSFAVGAVIQLPLVGITITCSHQLCIVSPLAEAPNLNAPHFPFPILLLLFLFQEFIFFGACFAEFLSASGYASANTFVDYLLPKHESAKVCRKQPCPVCFPHIFISEMWRGIGSGLKAIIRTIL